MKNRLSDTLYTPLISKRPSAYVGSENKFPNSNFVITFALQARGDASTCGLVVRRKNINARCPKATCISFLRNYGRSGHSYNFKNF